MKSSEILVHINKLTDENKEVIREEIITAVKNLNEVWSYLYQAEQRKIVKLLINSARIRDKGLKLNLNLDGLNRLLLEVA